METQLSFKNHPMKKKQCTIRAATTFRVQCFHAVVQQLQASKSRNIFLMLEKTIFKMPPRNVKRKAASNYYAWHQKTAINFQGSPRATISSNPSFTSGEKRNLVYDFSVFSKIWSQTFHYPSLNTCHWTWNSPKTRQDANSIITP